MLLANNLEGDSDVLEKSLSYFSGNTTCARDDVTISTFNSIGRII